MKKRITAKIVFKRNSQDVKSYLFLMQDKSITLRTMVLYREGEDAEAEFGDIIYSRFGKILVQRKDIPISQETIDAMHHLTHLDLNAPEDGILMGRITR